MKKYVYVCGVLLCSCMLSGCVERIHTVYAGGSGYDVFVIKTKEDAFTLKDGTKSFLWQPDEESREYSYRLEDGQSLLGVELPGALDETYEPGLKGASAMEPEALEAAQAYYDALGQPFDIPDFLEDAYADYKQCVKDGDRFWVHSASQQTAPCVETERFVGFETITEIPDARGAKSSETSEVVLFDVSTGEVLSPEDLFTISKEEAGQILSECCKEQMWYEEWEAVKPLISIERAQWMQDWIRIPFLEEEMPEPEDPEDGGGFEVRIPYEEIKEYLQPWAIPAGESDSAGE